MEDQSGLHEGLGGGGGGGGGGESAVLDTPSSTSAPYDAAKAVKKSADPGVGFAAVPTCADAACRTDEAPPCANK